uniref:Uncharacterized protein n=1 Tax=Astyanax mexicanus TaxID=7994 RepID=A0A3B1JVT7_ASTMX
MCCSTREGRNSGGEREVSNPRLAAATHTHTQERAHSSTRLERERKGIEEDTYAGGVCQRVPNNTLSKGIARKKREKEPRLARKNGHRFALTSFKDPAPNGWLTHHWTKSTRMVILLNGPVIILSDSSDFSKPMAPFAVEQHTAPCWLDINKLNSFKIKRYCFSFCSFFYCDRNHKLLALYFTCYLHCKKMFCEMYSK